MAGAPETEEQRRRRLAQTKFGTGGDTSRQKRLFAEERTLGGGLYVPPGEAARPHRETEPRRLNPPGPRVSEYGPGGRQVPERVTVPPPTAPPPPPFQPQQTLQPRPQLAPQAPATYAVRTIPTDVTAQWHVPAGFVLREKQLEAVRTFHATHKGSVVFATGTGKTAIAAAIINDLRIPTVVIVPTLVLVDQWRRMLRAWGINAGVWSGEAKEPNYVTVSTYQSLYVDPSLIRRFPLVVFDEAHRATAEEFRALIYEIPLHPYAVALTATTPEDYTRKELLESFLPIIATLTPAEAIESGHLSRVVVEPIPVSLSGLEQQDYDKLSRTLASTSRQMGTSNPTEVARLVNSLQYSGPARAYLKALGTRRFLLSNVQAKQGAVLDVVRRNPRQRVLIFSESVPAVNTICEYLRANSIGCQVITGETEGRDRRFILDNWGKTFFVLASVRVLELGVDVPEVGIAIFVASGSGKLQLTQRLGRILRPSPGKDHATAYVIYANDTVENRVARMLQRIAGQNVTVSQPSGLEEYDEE